MKIFFYKTLLVALVFFITFKLTIGSIVNEIEHKITQTISKENAEKIKQDLREGMNRAIKKENFINKEDAALINSFIDKIIEDLKK